MLCLLGRLALQKGEEFQRIEQVADTQRRYFARTRQEIGDCGRSVAPRQIPGTENWMATNISNALKASILEQVLEVLEVLQVLQVPGAERRSWIDAVMKQSDAPAGSSIVRNVPEEDDDPYKI